MPDNIIYIYTISVDFLHFCLCVCVLYISMTCNPIVICLFCIPAVHDQCVEAKRKARSLPQALSFADLLEGVYMVCDYGFVLNIG